MPPESSFHRPTMLRRLEDELFDVLVVGGGVTGAGVALDAASRGLRVALVERDDFASGTSSKSSKMAHGGLRYLQQGDVELVYQALRERQRLFRNAPHLVDVLPFMIPVMNGKEGVVPRKVARALGSALWAYDTTGGWRIGKLHRRVRRNAALAHIPTLRADRLAWAYVYFDGSVDDARLVLTLLRTAATHGAAVANRCTVVGLTRDDGGAVNGATVSADGRAFAVRASVVVNAAGVWSDDLRAFDEGSHPDSIRPAKGVHITVPWQRVRNDISIIIPVPNDKRSLFVVPWGPKADGTFEHTYIGTTDTDYDGPVDDPQCTRADIDYCLRAANAAIVATDGPPELSIDDITGVWAGLRPLVKSVNADDKHAARTADLSRHHVVADRGEGVITITGGKLTTYREMAEDTVDAVVRRLHASRQAQACQTKSLRLLGAARRPLTATEGTLRRHLHRRYGSLAGELLELIAEDGSLAEPLVPGLSYVRAEAVYAARHEMAVTLDDILTRRTRARLFDRARTAAVAADVARLVAAELGWSDDERNRQVVDFLASCDAEIAAALPMPQRHTDPEAST